jgi:hypothetical protein
MNQQFIRYYFEIIDLYVIFVIFIYVNDYDLKIYSYYLFLWEIEVEFLDFNKNMVDYQIYFFFDW